MNSDYIITREDQLSAIFGEPSDLVKQKIGDSLNESMRTFIERSPLVFYSTVDSRGLIDVSPKGWRAR